MMGWDVFVLVEIREWLLYSGGCMLFVSVLLSVLIVGLLVF